MYYNNGISLQYIVLIFNFIEIVICVHSGQGK